MIMCLTYNKEATTLFKKSHRDYGVRDRWITVYKSFLPVVDTRNKTVYLVGRYRRLRVFHVGINISNRKCHQFRKINEDWMDGSDREYSRGMHVYVNNFSELYMNKAFTTLPVLVKLKDFVACGYKNDAVFMKIKIPQSSIDILMVGYPGYTFLNKKS